MPRSIVLSASLSLLALIGCGSQPYYGSVSLGAQPANPTTAFTASAAFYLRLGSPPACQGTQIASCCYVPAGPSLSPPAPASAGTITLTDNGKQIGRFAYDGAGYTGITSVFSESPDLAWGAGDTIDVSASGAAVQAFSGSAVAPADIAGINPTPDPSNALTVTAASGLTVTWTRGSGGSSFVLLLEDGSANDITCEVPITAGTLSVPSSLLTHLSGFGNITAYPQAASNFDGPNANLAILISGSRLSGMASFE